MRILFTSTPGAGHFRPLLPLAQMLARRRHDVAFACSDSLRPQVEAAGLQSFTAGRWITEQPNLARVRTGAESHRSAREATIAVYLNVMVDSNTRLMVPDLISICRHWKPDIVVREQAEFGGAIASEHLGLPHAAVQVLFFHGHTGLERMISKRLNRIRREWDLPPDPELDMLYRYLFLSFTPPAFLRSLSDIPRTMHFLQLVEPNSRTGDLPYPWLAQELHRPVIYATLGTTMERAQTLFPGRFPEIFPALIEGLQAVAGTLVLTVGPHRDPAGYDPHLPHVHVERYVPHDVLFPRCDLVVTHGGHNTVVPSLLHGLPLVLIPFWADQPDNAQRCAELGVGRVIEPVEITPERLTAAVQEVPLVPGYRRQAREIRDEMLALPPVEHGVTLLEQLARTRCPIVAGAGS